MAFYRNYMNGTVPDGVLNDNSQGGGTLGNDDLEGTSSMDKGKMEEDGEPYVMRSLNEPPPEDDDDDSLLNLPNSNVNSNNNTRKATGRWGSTFWKDCQPMNNRNGSESGHESKSSSEYNVEEGSGNDLSEVDKANKGQNVDEMLSDDYYELDGDDQSDSMHHKFLNNAAGYSSVAQPQVVANNFASRKKPKSSYGAAYVEDVDFEDDEEEDEDDPADADFDPASIATSVGRGNKGLDEDWEGEELDEDDNFDEDELDISDDDFYKKPSGMQRQKRGRSGSKFNREPKPSTSFSRRKRGRTSYDEEESSANDSDDDIEEDFKSTRRRSSHPRKETGGRSISTKGSGKNNEVRTSTRSVRKVSYVESDESEEHGEDIKRKGLKEDMEEEDGDSIEKVLWHQPKGMAEEAARTNKSTEPLFLNHLFDSEPDWNNTEFYIKWKGQSHLHCQWKSFSELQKLSGFKKVVNYTKKVMEDIRHRRTVSREEIEVIDVSKEMDLDLIKQNCQVERIIADRISKSLELPEYLVKWQGLSYAEATWYTHN